MDIALVTGTIAADKDPSGTLAALVARTDAPLREALEARGITVHDPVWHDQQVEWADYDLAVVRTTWDYSPRRDEFVAWAARAGEATRLHNGPNVLRWNSHKSYLLELEERGAPVVPTAWIGQGDRIDLPELLQARGWSQAVLKPAVGAGSAGLCRVAVRHDAADASTSPGGVHDLAAGQNHLDALAAAGDVLVQPFAPTVTTRGELSVVLVEGKASHAVRKHPADGDYRVQGSHGGRYVPEPVNREVAALAEWIVEVAEADALFARVDLIEDDVGTHQLMELELIEPDLFLGVVPESAPTMADAIMQRAGK